MSGAVVVPDLGDQPAPAVLVRWLVAAGTDVRVGQPVAELAVDKAEIEVASPAAGALGRSAVAVADAVRAGQVLATVSAAPSTDDRRSGAATGSRAAAPRSTVASTAPREDASTWTEPLSPTRKAIARTMMRSLATSAQLTAVREIDVSAVMQARAELGAAFRERTGVSLSPLPFLIRAACLALGRHPAVNASIDTEAGTATFRRHVDLGVAVDTPRGLLVATVPEADDLTVGGLATAISAVAKRARAGELRPTDTRQPTFTVTNTGTGGTTLGTPILVPPQVAILATYAIERRPAVVTDAAGNEAIAARWRCDLALTYDHRMLDGADAARFLADVATTVEGTDLRGEIRG